MAWLTNEATARCHHWAQQKQTNKQKHTDSATACSRPRARSKTLNNAGTHSVDAGPRPRPRVWAGKAGRARAGRSTAQVRASERERGGGGARHAGLGPLGYARLAACSLRSEAAATRWPAPFLLTRRAGLCAQTAYRRPCSAPLSRRWPCHRSRPAQSRTHSRRHAGTLTYTQRPAPWHHVTPPCHRAAGGPGGGGLRAPSSPSALLPAPGSLGCSPHARLAAE